MLNYADDNNKNFFILNFEEQDDSYKVNLASGDNYSVSKTDENKQKLLKQMEHQAKYSKNLYNKSLKAKKSAIFWGSYDLVLLGINIFLIISRGSFLNWFCAGVFLLCSVDNIAKFKRNKSLIEDIEKHNLFLENQDKINEYLTDESYEKDNHLNLTNENKQVLNINDINDMSKKDVENILNDIDRDKEFGIERPRVLVKKYLNNDNKRS